MLGPFDSMPIDVYARLLGQMYCLLNHFALTFIYSAFFSAFVCGKKQKNNAATKLEFLLGKKRSWIFNLQKF